MLYKVTGSPEGEATLHRVISVHKDTIQSTTKGPLLSKTDDRSLNGLMAEEDQKVSVLVYIIIKEKEGIFVVIIYKYLSFTFILIR